MSGGASIAADAPAPARASNVRLVIARPSGMCAGYSGSASGYAVCMSAGAQLDDDLRKDVREDGSVEPSDLPPRGWWHVLKRTVREFQDDNLTDWAAALTYYAVLSLFPALIVLVALLGLLGDPAKTPTSIANIVHQVTGSSGTAKTVRTTITDVVSNRGGAGALFGVGLLGAIWSASGYIGAFIRANNVIYEIREGRPFWKLRPLQVLVTLVMVLLMTIVVIGLVMTGGLADAVGSAIGLGDTSVTVWNIAKWPAMALIVLFMLAVLYYTAPNVQLPKFRWITPGSVLALSVWAVATVGFAFYVKFFGSYNKTYGSLGGVVIFLFWLWLSNVAVLLGAEFNSELERERELAEGEPAQRRLQLPPREAPKSD
jgi:membrane protein